MEQHTYLKTKDPAKCYGCRACEQICPIQCISMIDTEEGFLYPEIDLDKCIHCNACYRVCPVDIDQTKPDNQEAYSFQSKVDADLLNSASGGAFAEIAKHFLERGAYVCGCLFDNTFKAKHVVTQDLDVVHRMQGSKYVQSDTERSFSQIRDLLLRGKEVIFSGTPCQCAGLKSFVGKYGDNLYLLDLVCHGVPSRKMFASYIQWLVQNKNSNISEYRFRDKSIGGWSTTGSYILESSGQKSPVYPDMDPYYYMFMYRSSTYMEACYQCKYSSMNRVGDLTIADFWGLPDYRKYVTSKGVSLIIVNTEKGRSLLKKMEDHVIMHGEDLQKAIAGNRNLTHPSFRPAERDTIYYDLEIKGFQYISDTYCKLFHIRPRFVRMIPQSLRRLIKGMTRRNLSEN